MNEFRIVYKNVERLAEELYYGSLKCRVGYPCFVELPDVVKEHWVARARQLLDHYRQYFEIVPCGVI